MMKSGPWRPGDTLLVVTAGLVVAWLVTSLVGLVK